jgi:hypothetical protein
VTTAAATSPDSHDDAIRILSFGTNMLKQTVYLECLMAE